eukprot:GSChrysophyteH1.ASY1.ANO1.3059.1 assembled CDS
MFKLLLLSSLLAFAAADVLHLTADNFDEYITQATEPVLVEFYAPWCGHGRSLAPEWEIAGKTFQPEDGITIAAFDATTSNDIAAKYEIQGFPTIKYFPSPGKTPEDYQGGRTAEQIVQWINDKIGTSRQIKQLPSLVTALTNKDFDKKVLGSKGALVKFYAPWCGHCKSLAPVYEQLANAFAGDSEVLIAKVDATDPDNEELGDRYDIQGFPKLKWFPANSDESEDYEEGRDIDSLVDFVNRKAGTQRIKDGSLAPGAGVVQVLNDLIDSRNGSKEANAGALYISIAKKILDKGDTYVENELTRLNKMMSSPSVSPLKRTTFQLKYNVLSAYYAVIASQ